MKRAEPSKATTHETLTTVVLDTDRITFEYQPADGALTLVRRKQVEYAQEVFIDLDEKGSILGIEILNPGIYSFHFIEKIADEYKVPQLKRIQHPEKMAEIVSG